MSHLTLVSAVVVTGLLAASLAQVVTAPSTDAESPGLDGGPVVIRPC